VYAKSNVENKEQAINKYDYSILLYQRRADFVSKVRSACGPSMWGSHYEYQ
jgi:hypothetical protein